STLSRTRRLYAVETHQAVFRWVLKILAEEGLVEGKTVSIDATMLEANAALRSLVRRDNGQEYNDYLKDLAQAAGIENPTREQLARLDRKRKKKGSSQEWKNPHDPDARITKMKDGSTNMAHKAEHAVDLSSGALFVGALQGADQCDTTKIHQTLAEAGEAVVELIEDEATKAPEEESNINWGGIEEVVADKGYHSGAVVQDLHAVGCRSYIPEPDRGRRHWEGKADEQKQVYANRRRIRGTRSKRLQRKRSELTERSMAHLYETGGMRRLHLKGRDNILKRRWLQLSADHAEAGGNRQAPAATGGLRVHFCASRLAHSLRLVCGSNSPRIQHYSARASGNFLTGGFAGPRSEKLIFTTGC